MYKKFTINLLVSLSIGLSMIVPYTVLAKDPNMAVSNKDSNGDGKVES